MNVESNSFDQLPFSKLFLDYVSGDSSLYHFFESTLPNLDALLSRADEFNFKGDRKQTVSLLKDFNLKFQASESTLENIESLAKPESLTIVTGQQVSLLGGPLYTIYKIITAIVYAGRLQKETDRTVVPVFWLADEDHDIDEVSTLGLIDPSGSVRIRYNHKNYQHGQPAAGSILLGDEFEKFKSKITEKLDDTDFTDRLWREIGKCYHKDDSFAESFGKWLLKLFGNYGLVLAGSHHDAIKEHSKSIFKTSVTKQQLIVDTLDDSTYRLIEDGYHGQVQVQPSNLFYYDKNRYRQKIQYVDEQWTTPDKQWSSDKLIDEIDHHPMRFSPNVFLRPILQDHLLPVAAYIGGPGEIAYYAQMKKFYHIFDKKMPLIIPRFSITLVESAIDRIKDELPFEWTEYQQRIEDLEKSYVWKTEEANIEKIFDIWKSHIEELSFAKKKEIMKIDPTLSGSVGKAKAIYFSELDKLKGKVYRSVKKQDQIQLDRILRIKQNFFPNGNLQEREIAFIWYMNKYGLNVWDNLFEQLSEEEPFTHKRIYL